MSEQDSVGAELANALTGKLARDIKQDAEAFAGISRIDFHKHVYARLNELLQGAESNTAKLAILKEMRFVGEQLTAHEVGMERAKALNKRTEGAEGIRKLTAGADDDADLELLGDGEDEEGVECH